MKKLRVVGSSRDSSELILSNKPKGREGSHSVEIDKRLLDVLQKAVYARRDQERADSRKPRLEPQSKLPPREIQRHLRAGQAPAHVARMAEVSQEYVEQFYTPVLYERAGVIQDAQVLYQEKARLGPSSLPLGEAVVANLSARHVRTEDDALADSWSATRQDGHPWVVSLTFPFRGRARTARWRFDQRSRSLEPANKLASDIGWTGEGKRARPRAAEERAEKPAARRRPARKKGAARKKAPARGNAAARKKAPSRKKAAPRRKAPTRRKTSARKKAAPRRKVSTRKKAAPRRKPAARRKPVARRKTSARKKAAPRRKTSARKPTRRKSAARRKTARRRR